MNQIEKLHLDVIRYEYNDSFDEGGHTEMNCEKAAIKSAEITEQIAIEFLRYYHQTAELSFHSTGHNQGKPHKEIYQQFLKERQ